MGGSALVIARNMMAWPTLVGASPRVALPARGTQTEAPQGVEGALMRDSLVLSPKCRVDASRPKALGAPSGCPNSESESRPDQVPKQILNDREIWGDRAFVPVQGQGQLVIDSAKDQRLMLKGHVLSVEAPGLNGAATTMLGGLGLDRDLGGGFSLGGLVGGQLSNDGFRGGPRLGPAFTLDVRKRF